ncbi:MAG: hypothetical protein ABIH66_10925 [bacterium]
MQPSLAKKHVEHLEKTQVRMKEDLEKIRRHLGNLNGRQFSRFQRAQEANRLLEAAIAELEAIR